MESLLNDDSEMPLSTSEDENQRIGNKTTLNDVENTDDIENTDDLENTDDIENTDYIRKIDVVEKNKNGSSKFSCTECGIGFNQV